MRVTSGPLLPRQTLIGELANAVTLAAPGGNLFKWDRDAFICDALSITIRLLLDQLRPKEPSDIQNYFSGPEGVHPLYRDVLASPEAWAKHVFLGLWDELTSTPVQSVSDQKEILGSFFDKREAGDWSQHTYDLARARRALGFKENWS